MNLSKYYLTIYCISILPTLIAAVYSCFFKRFNILSVIISLGCANIIPVLAIYPACGYWSEWNQSGFAALIVTPVIVLWASGAFMIVFHLCCYESVMDPLHSKRFFAGEEILNTELEKRIMEEANTRPNAVIQVVLEWMRNGKIRRRVEEQPIVFEGFDGRVEFETLDKSVRNYVKLETEVIPSSSLKPTIEEEVAAIVNNEKPESWRYTIIDKSSSFGMLGVPELSGREPALRKPVYWLIKIIGCILGMDAAVDNLMIRSGQYRVIKVKKIISDDGNFDVDDPDHESVQP